MDRQTDRQTNTDKGRDREKDTIVLDGGQIAEIPETTYGKGIIYKHTHIHTYIHIRLYTEKKTLGPHTRANSHARESMCMEK